MPPGVRRIMDPPAAEWVLRERVASEVAHDSRGGPGFGEVTACCGTEDEFVHASLQGAEFAETRAQDFGCW